MLLIDADRLMHALGLASHTSAEKSESCDFTNEELYLIISQEAFLRGKDMVEVVRCKDCYHMCEDKEKGILNQCYLSKIYVKPEYFCNYGRRK